MIYFGILLFQNNDYNNVSQISITLWQFDLTSSLLYGQAHAHATHTHTHPYIYILTKYLKISLRLCVYVAISHISNSKLEVQDSAYKLFY